MEYGGGWYHKWSYEPAMPFVALDVFLSSTGKIISKRSAQREVGAGAVASELCPKMRFNTGCTKNIQKHPKTSKIYSFSSFLQVLFMGQGQEEKVVLIL